MQDVWDTGTLIKRHYENITLHKLVYTSHICNMFLALVHGAVEKQSFDSYYSSNHI